LDLCGLFSVSMEGELTISIIGGKMECLTTVSRADSGSEASGMDLEASSTDILTVSAGRCKMDRRKRCGSDTTSSSLCIATSL
jgi:hypothetical protein